ncbi:hypothetical protein [Pseudoteredinibacter isoporae]|uniref:Uncharacterized protein n=1 Tax=Pseudoteredinibacter isoporae TaxID=570281 RepID=A0A7X0MX70_9GAMM|nr:hypothetical protein [Pseudoteredinibacter isoporae]MBB6523411.1 hypothetical protein [Pseudoteredinibacter isoporae]NHO88922.1 hypothetical protein [Pseudoteredinibacter isoporae]NIB24370.1 hypothetical protein [Pseudoteredinibacter isoporae]
MSDVSDFSSVCNPSRRRTACLFSVLLLASFSPASSAQTHPTQYAFEHPTDYTFKSGFSVISGWHCEANRIEVFIDGNNIGLATMHAPRSDKKTICGHEKSGFSLFYDYNALKAGWHRIALYADGKLILQRHINTARITGVGLNLAAVNPLNPFLDLSKLEMEQRAFSEVNGMNRQLRFGEHNVNTRTNSEDVPEKALSRIALELKQKKTLPTSNNKFLQPCNFGPGLQKRSFHTGQFAGFSDVFSEDGYLCEHPDEDSFYGGLPESRMNAFQYSLPLKPRHPQRK